MSRIQEKFDVDYWSTYIVEWDLNVFCVCKSKKGVIWEARHENPPSGFLRASGSFQFFLDEKNSDVFWDLLQTKGYKSQKDLTSGEWIEELYDLPHVLFTKGSLPTQINVLLLEQGFFRVGSLWRSNSLIWKDVEYTGAVTPSPFGFTANSRSNMLEFLKLRTHKDFNIEKYKEIIENIQRCPTTMHSKVQEFLLVEALKGQK